MKLVIDIGNSRVKWARVDQERIGPGEAFDRSKPLAEGMEHAWSTLPPPEAVLVSSVAGAELDDQLARWMSVQWQLAPRFFRAEAGTLGIRNAYPDPTRMGSDRWAAVIGARLWSTGAVGVIDCGTAVTLDFVDGDDCHRGGWIFPGLALSRSSLLTRTASVREAAPQAGPSLGRSTAECVASGTLLGLAGVLQRWMAEAGRGVAGVDWIATGGDWPRLSPLMPGNIRHDPDLVLRGLARVLG